MHGRRALPWLVAAAGGIAAGAAWAQGSGAAPRRTGDLWFDPTQLPSFTGTVERYLLNPQGQTDALLFREGPQIVFPPDMAEALRQAAAPGRPLIVWGVRARSAPVITMLAFSPNPDAIPRIVERPYWRLDGWRAGAEAGRLSVAGTVRQPYWSPQGEVVGAVLDDGTVVMLPQGVTAAAEGLRDLMKPGAKLAAEGPGSVVAPVDGGAPAAARALLADRLGDSPDTLRPVPAPSR
jgi:hypothetical protein